MRRWASAASFSGRTTSTSGRMRPSRTSSATRRTSALLAPLLPSRATERWMIRPGLKGMDSPVTWPMKQTRPPSRTLRMVDAHTGVPTWSTTRSTPPVRDRTCWWKRPSGARITSSAPAARMRSTLASDVVTASTRAPMARAS
nr:hypothetical protein [Bacillota bacterium]